MTSESPDPGPRIYNLFPLLAGSVEDWCGNLPRIAALKFNWVYLNPFHYPGFSGSLYAIKDPYAMNELFATGDGDVRLRELTRNAREAGLGMMMDLVINHTARDATLVGEHPSWYRRELGGELYSPRAVDPDDPAAVTVWGDLAELDYEHPRAREELIDYWSRYLEHHIALGFTGFRCDAAYQVPAAVWQPLIAVARAVSPQVRFFAETLGCTIAQVTALREAGFDYLFNSSKWWDFHSDWLLDQYNRFRDIAPSVAFPESHDTERLAAELGLEDPEQVERHYRLRYLFAACFSTGVMMPMGFEYGFRRRLDVVHTRKADWEHTAVDLSTFVAATNAMKAALPVLNREGPQRRLSAPGADPVVLLRENRHGGDCALLLINSDRERSHAIDSGALLARAGGLIDQFTDVTPQASPFAIEPGRRLTLEPVEMRVFHGRRRTRRRPPARNTQAGNRLARLAEQRVVIENVWPQIDGGRHPVKRVVGDVLEVWADIFSDGHEALGACVRYREAGSNAWREAPMAFFDNDRWRGEVPLARNALYRYTIEAWRDHFATWRSDFLKKRAAGQAIDLELIEGRDLVAKAAAQAGGLDGETLAALVSRLESGGDDAGVLEPLLLDEALPALMRRAAPRANLSRYQPELEVVVDRTAAVFSAWYELFPRSTSGDPRRHGTFRDVITWLPYVRDLGFDVLYLPPIHPIGLTHRKGRNNALQAGPDDPGSPWAIGSAEGGHRAIHPALGTFDDFHRLLLAAREHGLEIALDFAIQCSPDHPWIREHPEWFDWRPDGTIKYAENPPKRYQDIVNVHFYGDALPTLWFELRDVVLFWVERGVRIFRVDNPHTKPVPFWEWLIREVQRRHPEVIFLSEAFTRPKMMKKLAKAGFTQSYSYFTWRNTRAELTEYLTELTRGESREYMRPNFFVNTPDINPIPLQNAGRAAFQIRAVLAATLSAAWGLYSGFELCESEPLPGREEYLNSEKYEIKARDADQPGNIRDYIARLNRIRRENPALQAFLNLNFFDAHDDQVLFYGKHTADRDNIIWIAVNLDPDQPHETTIELPLASLGLDDGASVQVENLFGGERFHWQGREQRIRLDPTFNPCEIWRITFPERGNDR